MNPENSIPIFVVLLGVVIALLVIWSVMRKRHADQLRSRYRAEYKYMVDKEGDARKAEKNLEERQNRVAKLDIHPLPAEARDIYSREWIEIQSKFVDDPKGAVDHANRLITEVMIARGFPVADFEQRAADLSVLYPEFVPDYRNAYAIALRNQNDGTSTEDLRKAMIYYHSLFEELLGIERTKELEATR